MSEVKAIGPSDVVSYKKSSIPGNVIAVFNQLIGESFNGGRAVVKQEAVVRNLVAQGFNREEIFERGWLDVEGIFEEQGWKVEYDKPGYNESYGAYFVFKAK